jgi:hypothetical protein
MGWGAEADTGRSEGSEFLELLDGSISQFRDLARHLLLIGYELFEAARYLLLTRGKPVCAACDLLLNWRHTGGDPVYGLPYGLEIERYWGGLLLIGE